VLIGVLALQGAFAAHRRRLTELGVASRDVRQPRDLLGVDGLVMPGGESTTMSNLLTSSGLFDEIAARVDDGLAVFGTCAGLILLSRDGLLGGLDVGVRRNAYGRQVMSFEADLELDGEEEPLRGVFIRAPRVEDAGAGVEVLAEHDGEPVLLRQGRLLAASFHPELTGDTRVHERFLEMVREEARVRA
jgi:pyridoxal 5'-phosphate synthase pdxT subunit